jgi:hypothetical protein
MNMKTAFLFLLITTAAFANRMIESAAIQMDTGKHDFYNLGAYVGDEPAKYVLAIASYKLIDPKKVDARYESGEPLPIDYVGSSKAFFRTSIIVQLVLDRAKLEQGAQTGLKVNIAGIRGPVSLSIPAPEIESLLRSADFEDSERTKRLIRELETKIINEQEAARDLYLKTNPNLPAKIAESIRNKSLCIGMNFTDAKAALGTLTWSSSSDGIGGPDDYFHGRQDGLSVSLYFHNGKLIRWSTN